MTHNVIDFESRRLEREAEALDFSPDKTSKNLPQRALRTLGLVTTYGGKSFLKGKELSDVNLRRRGLAVLLTGTLALAGAAKGIESGFDYAMNTDIPTSTQGLDPAKYHEATIPAAGADALLQQVDPNHDARNGETSLAIQLGHDPKPGDEVWVPNQSQNPKP